jgi:thermolysin
MLNAFWCSGCGPAFHGAIVFGEGLPPNIILGGQTIDYLSGGLDVVAHELTHGLTSYTSDLIYRNESGALDEAFSDIVGTSVEFFYQTPGTGTRQADYLIGEDVFRPGGLRSMSNPAAYGDPDHYSKRYTGSEDGGGVHTNSGIPNQAFYLAVEGGTNRTSGLSVSGVGGANREQIEKAFYRAFAFMLPSNATFAAARAATIQAARDLYGAGSPAERAITQGWTAVGVN